MELINVYCDESCYMEFDQCPIMTIGGIWCAKSKIKEITSRINDIKQKHNIKKHIEFKWTQVSKSKKEFYLDVINYFFDNNDINFRCLIADKTNLNHEEFNQTHDDWYYKMYFQMLQNILNNSNSYNIYIDIKEKKRGGIKARFLRECLSNKNYDFNHTLIKQLQIIDSKDSVILQLSDLLTGAIGYHNRKLTTNQTKLAIIDLIKKRSGFSLEKSTFSSEKKFNLFKWEGQKTCP